MPSGSNNIMEIRNLPSYIFTTLAEPVPGVGERIGERGGGRKVHPQVAVCDGGGFGRLVFQLSGGTNVS